MPKFKGIELRNLQYILCYFFNTVDMKLIANIFKPSKKNPNTTLCQSELQKGIQEATQYISHL